MGTPVDLAGDDLYVDNLFIGNTVQGQQTQGAALVLTAATTLTNSQMNSNVIFNSATGFTVTLPAPVVGATFNFIIGTVATSGSHKIITSAGTVFLTGGVYFDKSLTITRYDGNNSTHVSLNFNGTTTGGATIGDTVTLTCVSATSWTVEGTVTASGTLATPFATS